MPTTAKKLAQAQLGTAFSTLYTAPALTTTRITEFWACNTDTVAHTLQVCVVTAAGAAGAGNALVWNMNINPGGILPLSCNQVLGAGDFIAALASAASVITLTVAGIELT